MEQYSVHLKKDTFSFSAAHFLVFNGKSRESLHGHNYQITFSGSSKLQEDGMVFDFLKLEVILKKICSNFDHKIILPQNNPHLNLRINSSHSSNNNIEIQFQKDFFSFPQSDVLILDCDNSSVENIAKLLSDEISKTLQHKYNFSFQKQTIEITELPGCSAKYIFTEQENT